MCTHSAETNSVLLEIGTFVQTKKLWNLDELQLRYLGVEENALTLIFFENDNFAFSATYLRVENIIHLYLSTTTERPEYTTGSIPQSQGDSEKIAELCNLCLQDGDDFTVHGLTIPYKVYMKGKNIPVGRVIQVHNTLALQLGNVTNGYRTLHSVSLPKHSA